MRFSSYSQHGKFENFNSTTDGRLFILFFIQSAVGTVFTGVGGLIHSFNNLLNKRPGKNILARDTTHTHPTQLTTTTMSD